MIFLTCMGRGVEFRGNQFFVLSDIRLMMNMMFTQVLAYSRKGICLKFG